MKATPNAAGEWIELQQVYGAAICEITSRLEGIYVEYQLCHSDNPIHRIEYRLKSMKSIIRKAEKLNLPKNISAVKEKLMDIAGVRVICNYPDDINKIEESILSSDDVQLLKRKDYITHPKPCGYRSLHLIITLPVFLNQKTEIVPVEIQLRTIPMDYWARLDHRIQYKTESPNAELYYQQLTECADQLAEIENKIKCIHQNIHSEI